MCFYKDRIAAQALVFLSLFESVKFGISLSLFLSLSFVVSVGRSVGCRFSFYYNHND